jgi:hypothetical protein
MMQPEAAGVHSSSSVYSWTGFCSALRKIDTLEGLEFHKGTSTTQFLVNIASLLAQVCARGARQLVPWRTWGMRRCEERV